MRTHLPRTDRVVDLTRLERAEARRRRRRLGAAVLAALVGAGVAAAAFALIRDGSSPAGAPSGVRRLTVLLVRGGAEPLFAVVGEGAGGEPAAVVIPAATVAVLPGYGEGRLGEAARLDGAAMRIAVSNLLGAWAEHYAVLDLSRVARLAGRMGGLEVRLASGHASLTGPEIERLLGREHGDAAARWGAVLEGLLEGPVAVRPADLLDADDQEAVHDALAGAKGAGVEVLPTERGAGALLRPDLDATAALLATSFGIEGAPVPVIVQNGSGAPGVGEAVAERLVPAGYRIVVSGNAESFDVSTTAIVASEPADEAEARRVRHLLGVGVVVVSRVPSGLGDVTIVVGEDFANG